MPSSLGLCFEQIKNFTVFAGESDSQILELCKNAIIVQSKHREVLFNYKDEAHYFGIVIKGAYKLSKPTFSGHDVIVHFSTPGEVIAALIMSQPNPIYPVSSIAMGPSVFLKIPKENYNETWRKNSNLIFRVQNLITNRMTKLQDEKALAKAPLTQKVASMLMSLMEGVPDEKVLTVPLPLTRQEIADTLGASVESVIRIMSDWSKQEII